MSSEISFNLLVGGAFIAVAYIAYKGFRQVPGQIEGDMQSMIGADVTDNLGTADHPVQQVSGTTLGVSGIGAQAPSQPSVQPVNSGIMSEAQSASLRPAYEDWLKSSKASEEWLKTNPASVPVKRNRPGDMPRSVISATRIEQQARAAQYAAAANVMSIVPVSLDMRNGGVSFNPVKAPADIARSNKSQQLGTLKSGTMPPVGVLNFNPTSLHSKMNFGHLNKRSK